MRKRLILIAAALILGSGALFASPGAAMATDHATDTTVATPSSQSAGSDRPQAGNDAQALAGDCQTGGFPVEYRVRCRDWSGLGRYYAWAQCVSLSDGSSYYHEGIHRATGAFHSWGKYSYAWCEDGYYMVNAGYVGP
ncbi:hypothetical protein BJY16_001813 [Actinoplanes octamycinicus]|uniref:Uncharacterized protein n=1 Tax=Actinoplanes octamycinicus TaxID=135948 RepID=A0A7W7GU71_9ACTN|nr:hypothetical protein [Actinoplanes octamycinicus]MBB4738354.1 hypothetical protein [Actinoplanes octamycinicus]GIE57471.1 hypothetical protein Aoc01nite_28730 [Actinoplanes octamycinicus]